MKKHNILSVCVLCALVIALALPVLAESTTPGSCSLTLEYIDEGQPLKDAAFRLYCAATGSAGSYDLTESFKDFQVGPGGLRWSTAEELETITGDLTDYIASAEIEPDHSGSTDGDGQLSFRELQPGLYLVLGESLSKDGLIYTSQPILTWLPCADPDGELIYDLVCQPKFIKDTEYTKRTVEKIWIDDGSHPSSVVVQLLCDGEKYDEVTLNAENNWKHVWEELPSAHIWTVVEKEVPAGYTATVTQDGVAFTITNTKTDTPKTGDTGNMELWLALATLSGTGIIMVVILFPHKPKNRREEA